MFLSARASPSIARRLSSRVALACLHHTFSSARSGRCLGPLRAAVLISSIDYNSSSKHLQRRSMRSAALVVLRLLADGNIFLCCYCEVILQPGRYRVITPSSDFGVFGLVLLTVPTFPIVSHTPALRPDRHGLDGYTFPMRQTRYWNWPRPPTADWLYVGFSCSSERLVQRIYDAGIVTIAGKHMKHTNVPEIG